MGSHLDAHVVYESSRYCPDLDLLYLNNPKAACSSIKQALWRAVDQRRGISTYAGNPHQRDDGCPFVFDLRASGAATSLGRATAFSMVRNPYTRILASYLDKVGHDRWVWPAFARRVGLQETATQEQFSFADLLHVIADEPDEQLDPHFRSQNTNLLMPEVRPHVIGFVEEPSEVAGFLWDKIGIELDRHPKPETNAAGLLLEYYTEELTELVRERFKSDFESFGYSTDLADARQPGRLPSSSGGNLDALISLRDSAQI